MWQNRTQLNPGIGVTSVMGSARQRGGTGARYVATPNLSLTVAASLQAHHHQGPR